MIYFNFYWFVFIFLSLMYNLLMLFLKKTINRFILPFLNLLRWKNCFLITCFYTHMVGIKWNEDKKYILYAIGRLCTNVKKLCWYSTNFKSTQCVSYSYEMIYFLFLIKISSRCMKSDVKNKHQSESSNVCFYTNFILLS